MARRRVRPREAQSRAAAEASAVNLPFSPASPAPPSSCIAISLLCRSREARLPAQTSHASRACLRSLQTLRRHSSDLQPRPASAGGTLRLQGVRATKPWNRPTTLKRKLLPWLPSLARGGLPPSSSSLPHWQTCRRLTTITMAKARFPRETPCPRIPLCVLLAALVLRRISRGRKR